MITLFTYSLEIFVNHTSRKLISYEIESLIIIRRKYYFIMISNNIFYELIFDHIAFCILYSFAINIETT